MKNWIPLSLLVMAVTVGGSSAALAQPRPPIQVDRKSAPDARKDPHDDHKGAPDARKDPRDDHKDLPDGRRDQPEARKEAPDARRDPGGDPRDHFIQRQNEEREQRKEAHKDEAAWNAARKQRAADRRKDIVTTWGSTANTAEAKAELALHADRMSRLNRVLDLAEDRNEPTVVARSKALIEREIARDTRVMQAIKAKGGTR